MEEVIVPIGVTIAPSGSVRNAVRAALVWWVRRGGDITKIEALLKRL
jgi:hypothetical protein